MVIDDADASQNLSSFCLCLKEARRCGTKVILNLRVSDANYIENRVVNSIFEHVYAYVDDFRLPVVRLRGFEKEQIVQWLERYQSQVQGSTLTFANIGEIHKRLRYAAGNPLFLYQLALYHRRYGMLESIYTVYQIYDVFVESTTTGRFDPPGAPVRARSWRLASLYAVFLEQVACTINNSRTLRTSSKPESDPNVDWRLDANEVMYSVSDRELSETVDVEQSEFLVRNDEVASRASDQRLQLLNNYFFTRSGESIGFKDNNILFFLVAKRLFRALRGLLEEDHSRVAESLSAIAETKGHPQAIEILLKRIQTEGEAFRSALARRIDELIKDNRIIQLTSESLERITSNTINRDIILSIILLHVRRGSYDQLDYFLTRLSWLTSAVKFQDSMYRTLIARFFRGIDLKDIEFRRLNCDEYNFRGTRFVKTKFIQCKLFSPVFDDTTHIDTQFLLCDFGGHSEVAKFSRIKGSISYILCRVGRLIVAQNEETASISLRQCDIDELYIESRNANANAKLDLYIRSSSIRRIFFVNVYLGVCEVRDSYVDQISDKNSRGTIHYSPARPASSVRWRKETGRIRMVEASDLEE